MSRKTKRKIDVFAFAHYDLCPYIVGWKCNNRDPARPFKRIRGEKGRKILERLNQLHSELKREEDALKARVASAVRFLFD